MAKEQGDLTIFAECTTQSGWSTFPDADFGTTSLIKPGPWSLKRASDG